MVRTSQSPSMTTTPQITTNIGWKRLKRWRSTKELLTKQAIDERHHYLIDNPVPHDHVARRMPIKIA